MPENLSCLTQVASATVIWVKEDKLGGRKIYGLYEVFG